FGAYRASVLWKANVYPSEAERRRVADDLLSLEEVARIFDADLAQRGAPVRFDLARLDEPAFAAELAGVYPEAVPCGAGRSIFDAA
ncbi:MAG: hypothetical protein OEV20_08995, partial [Actinomycetota bacterium]|nr:hypothetical protein [Actinomycetota bacterium]